MSNHFYPIGSPGKAWDENECKQWFQATTIQRSYENEVLQIIASLEVNFTVQQYGALSVNPKKYPLFALKSKPWRAKLPTALITGGVHGYETSGVQGALDFAANHSGGYAERFNLIIVPCVSFYYYTFGKINHCLYLFFRTC